MSEEIPQGVGGLRPFYQSYKHQKCFVGHSHEASWCADIVSACEETLPEFGLEPWYAAHNFDPTRPLRDKVVEMIANARYGIYDLSYWQRDNKGEWEMPRNVFIELGMAIVLNRPMLLLEHAESRKQESKLPECLESVSEYILEFSGEGTLKRILRERLPHWVNGSPERDWWNRYCLFGGMECKYREVHPQGVQIGKEKLHCHISDGLDADRPDFREVVGKVLKRFSDVDFNYLDNLSVSSGYNFLLCTHCQTVRSTPFAIYRITPETSGETFIAIGMSIALEKQFEYKIPKILLTANMQDIPSLLTGYEVVVARNDQDRKNRLREFLPEVIQKVRETSWRPRPLPFEVFVSQRDDMPILRGELAEVESLREGLPEAEGASPRASKDFFLSYNQEDRAWAEWIAWQLEAEGYTTMLQDWNFRPGSNFVLEMHQAAQSARRTIAVLSPNYLSALYIQPEWAAAFAQDPTGQQGTLLPVRVRACELPGLLASIVYIDLVGLNEPAALKALLAGVRHTRARPSSVPAFPGRERDQQPILRRPRFPLESTQETTRSVELFYSYAHKDEKLRNELDKHLYNLKRQGLIIDWYDRDITTGDEWKDEIDQHLNTAHIILLLISPDFMASDYCYSIEMKRALERHEAGEARVIPIILKPVDWQNVPFSKLQVLPKNLKAVTSWKDRNGAFIEIVKGIREALKELTINR